MKDTGANESVQFKEQERGEEVRYECKLTYLYSIKTDEMCSKMFLSEVKIFKAERGIVRLLLTSEFKLYSDLGNLYIFKR